MFWLSSLVAGRGDARGVNGNYSVFSQNPCMPIVSDFFCHYFVYSGKILFNADYLIIGFMLDLYQSALLLSWNRGFIYYYKLVLTIRY